MSQQKRLAILVGGGPAPGINSVIGAATIRSHLAGIEVLGVEDGFQWLMQGNIEHVRELTMEEVSRIHFRGGSYLGISRANPTRDPQLLENTVISLLRLNVSQLITIGGDDTAFSAMQLEKQAAGRIRVVHVPKTIDNDLDLPHMADTFGYQTARHVGCEIVKNLMVDARTTSRWYLTISMGRKAGHLALGIGKAAGVTVTLVPEEFGGTVTLRALVDTLAGSIIKRFSYGRRDGVAVIAEGVMLAIDPEDIAAMGDVERDAHDNIRLAEVLIGNQIKQALTRRLAEFGLTCTLVAKDIGYELRCADPIPVDMEYARDLGYCAAQYLVQGGNAAIVSMYGGLFEPVPFASLLDPKTGRARVRFVDINSARYKIARRYMIRLCGEDFEDPHELAKLAAVCKCTPERFREEFEYLTEGDPAPLELMR